MATERHEHRPRAARSPHASNCQESQFKKREKKRILASDPKKKGCKGTVLHLRQDSSPYGTQLQWVWLHFSLSYVKSFGKNGTI